MSEEDKKYEVKEKSGSLWIDNNAEILRKGSVLWELATENNNLEKDEKRYFTIIESENNKGEKKLEVAMSIGLVYVNDKKFSENSPDLSGNVTVDGIQYKFYGRKKESKRDGMPYTTVQLVEKELGDVEKLPF